jgi:hypothetical protein
MRKSVPHAAPHSLGFSALLWRLGAVIVGCFMSCMQRCGECAKQLIRCDMFTCASGAKKITSHI